MYKSLNFVILILLGISLCVQKYLWRHVERCANFGESLDRLVAEDSAKAQITSF